MIFGIQGWLLVGGSFVRNPVGFDEPVGGGETNQYQVGRLHGYSGKVPGQFRKKQQWILDRRSTFSTRDQ